MPLAAARWKRRWGFWHDQALRLVLGFHFRGQDK